MSLSKMIMKYKVEKGVVILLHSHTIIWKVLILLYTKANDKVSNHLQIAVSRCLYLLTMIPHDDLIELIFISYQIIIA